MVLQEEPRNRRRWLLITLIVVAGVVASVGAFYLFLNTLTSPQGCLQDLILADSAVSYWEVEVHLYSGAASTCPQFETARTPYRLLDQNSRIVANGTVSELSGANGISFLKRASSPTFLELGDRFRIGRTVAEPGFVFLLLVGQGLSFRLA